MVRARLLCDGFFLADKRTFLPDARKSVYPAAAKSLLVETEKEKILIDTGIADIPQGPRSDYLRSLITIKRRPNHGIKKQLAKLGIAPGEISTVIYTHLHAAHSGNASLFTNAKFYVAKSEYRYFYDLPEEDPKRMIYQPSNFEKLKNVEEIIGEYQLDEDVRILPTPGHTLGHQSVVVRLDGKNVVFCGDVSPLKSNLQGRIAMTGYDRPQILEQMRKLLKVKNAMWVFAHDSGQLSMRTAYEPLRNGSAS